VIEGPCISAGEVLCICIVVMSSSLNIWYCMLVCVFIVFSLCRESPDLMLVDEPLIYEVVLPQRE
jgi:hypothetical protein